MRVWIPLLFAAAALAQAPVQCPPSALTEVQVSELVKSQVPEGRIVQIIGTCHFGGFPGVEILERLQKAGAAELILQAVMKDGYSRLMLDQARVEFASLRQKLADRIASSNATRDSALARIDAEHTATREGIAPVHPQDQFESDASFAARKRQRDEEVARLDREYMAKRSNISRGFDDELETNTLLLNRQLSTLRAQMYLDEGGKVEFLRYDANQNQLMAHVGQTEYWFTIPNQQARELYGHWGSARLECPIEEDSDRTRYLLDSASGERYLGVPRRVVEEKNQAEAVEKLAYDAWLDGATGLMWSLHPSKPLTWDQASRLCRNLDLGGFSDWRLPNIGELEGIYDPREHVRAKAGFQNLSGYWAWSTTGESVFGEERLQYFSFYEGRRGSAKVSLSGVAGAICVRDVRGH